MIPVHSSTLWFGVSLASTRMFIPSGIWTSWHPHVLAFRLPPLLLVVVQIIRLLLWQHSFNVTLLPNITTRPSNIASVCAGTFGVRAAVVYYHTAVIQ